MLPEEKQALQKLKELLERMEDVKNLESAQKELRQLFDQNQVVRYALSELSKNGSTEFQDRSQTQRLILGYGQDQLGSTRLGPGTGTVLQGALGETTGTLDTSLVESYEQSRDKRSELNTELSGDKQEMIKEMIKKEELQEKFELAQGAVNYHSPIPEPK